jgi:uncharacterized protein (DUF427 family)
MIGEQFDQIKIFGVTIADSTHVMLLHEAGRLPVFYFPIEDVRMDMMVALNTSFEYYFIQRASCQPR